MNLMIKAETLLKASQNALLANDNAASIELALEAAKYLQLIRLLRTEIKGELNNERGRDQRNIETDP